MKDTDMEVNLRLVHAFLDKWTLGLIDDREQITTGAYLSDPELINIFAGNFELGTMFSHGLMDLEQMIHSSQTQPILKEFLTDYRELYLKQNKENTWDHFIDSCPDMVIELGFRNTQKSKSEIEKLRSSCNKDIILVSIDKSEKSILPAYNDIEPNIYFFNGTLNNEGDIEMENSDSPLSLGGSYKGLISDLKNKKAVIGERACGHTADNAAKYVLNINADSFVIQRCCFEKMESREPLTEVGKLIPFNKKVRDLISYGKNSDRYKAHIIQKFSHIFLANMIGIDTSRPTLESANFPLEGVLNDALNLDIALFLQEQGYKTSVSYPPLGKMVYGVKK